MTYVITASNHGLSNTPCNLAEALFGRYNAIGEHDSAHDTSREFATLAEAEAAKAELENSGDWPDGAPDYEITATEAVANG